MVRRSVTGFVDTLTDPLALGDRDDVSVVSEPRREHQHHFDLYRPIAGIVVVGVVDEDGRVLLQEHRQDDGVAPPYAPVREEGEWMATARECIRGFGDGAIEVTEVERLREKSFTPVGDDDRLAEGLDVVVRARPIGPPGDLEGQDGAWQLRWFDALPDGAPEEGAVREDMRLFFE